jgi:hypothetical protein
MARTGNRWPVGGATTGLSFTAIDAYGAPLADPAKVRSGADVVFVLTVIDPEDDRRYTADIARDGEVLVSSVPVDPTYALELESVSAEHAGEWTATLSANGTPLAAQSLSLDVKGVRDEGVEAQSDTVPDARRERRGLGDIDAAVWGVIAALVAFVLIGGITAVPIWARDDEDVPVVWFIALGLFLVGLLLALAGAYLVAMEARARLRAEQREVPTAGGIESDEAAPPSIVRTASLRAAIALLVLAGVTLVGAAWIGYGSTRPDSPANPPAIDATR